MFEGAEGRWKSQNNKKEEGIKAECARRKQGRDEGGKDLMRQEMGNLGMNEEEMEERQMGG